MSSRKNVLVSITTALKDDFPATNVVNKLITPTELLDQTVISGTTKFPWLNVALGVHTVTLDLGGVLEIEQRIPIIILAYEKADKDSGDDLQIRIADLADAIVNSLTTQAHANTFCLAGFGIETIQLFPAEDEEHYDVGVVTARVTVISGEPN